MHFRRYTTLQPSSSTPTPGFCSFVSAPTTGSKMRVVEMVRGNSACPEWIWILECIPDGAHAAMFSGKKSIQNATSGALVR
ncbi:hypothetical protein CPLU01_06161 [Colletotrichum plurivorum]|uniref:Uncharacterized protein n=1 Tax=Colletotrichum plurivorum TaxID=2175906 RepID=A0A8H6KK83_9PEZI|nr:hypothetical protein CPLU01_06161 [Colletotrichum plurivorum]